MGSVREREMVQAFEDEGWAALRVGGSGSGTSEPRPDLIVGDGGSIYWAVEEKYNANSLQTYIDSEKGSEITEWATRFGASPVAAVRYSTDMDEVETADWFICGLEDVERTNTGNYKLNYSQAKDWVTLSQLFDQL